MAAAVPLQVQRLRRQVQLTTAALPCRCWSCRALPLVRVPSVNVSAGALLGPVPVRNKTGLSQVKRFLHTTLYGELLSNTKGGENISVGEKVSFSLCVTEKI